MVKTKTVQKPTYMWHKGLNVKSRLRVNSLVKNLRLVAKKKPFAIFDFFLTL